MTYRPYYRSHCLLKTRRVSLWISVGNHGNLCHPVRTEPMSDLNRDVMQRRLRRRLDHVWPLWLDGNDFRWRKKPLLQYVAEVARWHIGRVTKPRLTIMVTVKGRSAALTFVRPRFSRSQIGTEVRS